MPRVLILGGTGEALELAETLTRGARFEAILSLAGRTAEPRLAGTAARRGGFGGAEPLAAYLTSNRIDALIDASHPFAARISANAALAAERAGTLRLALDRPAWTARPGDDWTVVAHEMAAAVALPVSARAFLALGSQHLAPFCVRTDVWFLLRTVDPPLAPLLPVPHDIVTGRGPFGVEDERNLLRHHRISHIVARNGGGAGAAAKLAAARELAIAVIMIARPSPPAGPTVTDVEGALSWLTERFP